MASHPGFDEIERKFLLIRRPEEIERSAIESGTLKCRRLIQQRYLDPRGWRMRLTSTTRAGGAATHAFILKKDSVRIEVPVSAAFHDNLARFCGDARTQVDGEATRERRRLRNPEEWVVRIRRSTDVSGFGAKAFLTLKRPKSRGTCTEAESDVPAHSYAEIADRCGPALRKRRIKVSCGGRVWEIDRFLNPELDGLALAEIELPSIDAFVVMPSWVGREVTDEKEYRNAEIQKAIGR